jgi:hypothetical protein
MKTWHSAVPDLPGSLVGRSSVLYVKAVPAGGNAAHAHGMKQTPDAVFVDDPHIQATADETCVYVHNYSSEPRDVKIGMQVYERPAGPRYCALCGFPSRKWHGIASTGLAEHGLGICVECADDRRGEAETVAEWICAPSH